MQNYTASIAFQVIPNVPMEQVRPIVGKILDYIKGCGMTYFIGPYETTIDGDFDSLVKVLKDCQKLCIEAGAPSAMTYIKMVYKPTGGVWSIEEKTTKHQH